MSNVNMTKDCSICTLDLGTDAFNHQSLSFRLQPKSVRRLWNHQQLKPITVFLSYTCSRNNIGRPLQPLIMTKIKTMIMARQNHFFIKMADVWTSANSYMIWECTFLIMISHWPWWPMRQPKIACAVWVSVERPLSQTMSLLNWFS